VSSWPDGPTIGPWWRTRHLGARQQRRHGDDPAYDLRVSDFVRTLHVLAAVLLIGPLVATPFVAWWAIRRQHPETVRFAANAMAAFGAGALLVAGFGLAALLTGDQWTLATPWVLISATLFVVALALIWGYAVPGLRRAASLVAEETTARAAAATLAPALATDTDGDRAEAATEESAGETGERASPDEGAAEELRRRHRLDRITARVTGAGWLLLAVFAVIVVLMTVRPFQ
jgi:uncharacterized membrane protein